MSDSLPKLPQKPVPPTPPTKPTPPTHLTQNEDNEINYSGSHENHIDYNSIGAAQLKSTKIQKPSVGAKPTKPVLKARKKPTSSLMDDAKRASKERKKGRISAKEFRKEFWNFLKKFLLWFIVPSVAAYLFCLFYVRTSNPIFSMSVAGLVGLWWAIGGIIFFIKIGLGTLIAQCQRINDMGMNGNLVVVSTILLCIVAYFVPVCLAPAPSNDLSMGQHMLYAESSMPSSSVYLGQVSWILAALWVLSLLFICLFKKGQPHDNKYGPACKD